MAEDVTAQKPTEYREKPGGGAPGGTVSNAHPQSVNDKNGAEKPAQPDPPKRKGVMIVVGIIVLIAAIIWGVPYYQYSRVHVSTDDAYVTGDLINVSPIISGTLSTLLVDEGDTVTKNELIAKLDDSGPAATLRQAQAAYDAAESQIPQAQTNLAFEQQTTDAAIQKAEAELATQQAKVQGAQAQAEVTSGTTSNQIKQAQSQIDAAIAQAEQAQAQVRTAQVNVQSARQMVLTAERGADAFRAGVLSAQANAQKAQLDAGRFAKLVAVDAATPEQNDAAVAANQTADAQLTAAQQQADQAQSQVRSARLSVNQSLAQLRAAQDQATAAATQVDVARAGLGLARANLLQNAVQSTNVQSNYQQASQSKADLQTALAGHQEIALRQQEIATVRAQAIQAKAALANAQVTEDDTKIYAPTDGTIVRKAVNPGAALSPGQAIVTMASSTQDWIQANFKETQLVGVKPGDKAEIDVDAVPGKIFLGRVRSINYATGSSTALLPPDNATGNFTKVVQRLPVKILLEAAPAGSSDKYATAEDIANLRQGESVTATIDTSSE